MCFQRRQIFHEAVGHAPVGHIIVAHRFCTFHESRGLRPRSEKKNKHTAQDDCPGDDQERHILAGLPAACFSAAFEIFHHAHLNRSYAHADARTVQSCSIGEPEAVCLSVWRRPQKLSAPPFSSCTSRKISSGNCRSGTTGSAVRHKRKRRSATADFLAFTQAPRLENLSFAGNGAIRGRVSCFQRGRSTGQHSSRDLRHVRHKAFRRDHLRQWQPISRSENDQTWSPTRLIARVFPDGLFRGVPPTLF